MKNYVDTPNQICDVNSFCHLLQWQYLCYGLFSAATILFIPKLYFYFFCILYQIKGSALNFETYFFAVHYQQTQPKTVVMLAILGVSIQNGVIPKPECVSLQSF